MSIKWIRSRSMLRDNKQSIRIMTKEIFFWICFIVYTTLTFYLFSKQASRPDGRYLSDMPSYIEGVLGTNERDPYPYRLFFWVVKGLNAFLPIGLAAAFGTLLFNTLTVFILRYYIEKYFIIETNDKGILKTYLPIIVTFSCLIASMVIIPIKSIYMFPGQYYIGQGSGNVWHNATYIATRPFATAAFFIFIEIIETINEKINIKKLILFSLSMFLTVFSKPTFAIVMIPTAAIVLIYLLIKEKFRNFKNIFYVALTFIPAGLDALRQYFPVFNSSGESGIGFGFGLVWREYTKSIPFSIILCFLFPIYIFFCNVKNKEYKGLMFFSLVFAFTSLFEGVFLYEKGPRMSDGNFLQGYLHAMFYLFIVSVIVWLTKRERKKRQLVYDIIALFFFTLHTVSGVWYFIHILTGNSFY